MLPTGSLGPVLLYDAADCNTRSEERQGNEALCVPSAPIYIWRPARRQVFDARELQMCLSFRLSAALLVAIGLLAGPRAAADPILPLLSAEDYDESRPQILETLRQDGAACRTLGAYASSRSTRVREHAVRALSDAGCADFAAYSGYAADGDAWVMDAVIRAAESHLIAGAVPFLLSRLSDPRRIVAGEGTWTIGDAAHGALRAITCQSFHYDAG